MKWSEPASYDFWRISKQPFSWGEVCKNLYLLNRKFQFIYRQALWWIKVFYLQPPPERLKPCCGVSNNIACLAMFKSLTEKHDTINHKIIFNASISKFYQLSIWGFCRRISMFFSICLGKKNAEVIKVLRILRNMSPRIKYIFVQEVKAMFCLIKKLFLSFTQFSNLVS